MQRRYDHSCESMKIVSASPELLFAYLDDHENLARHMMQSEGMMAGSAMHFEFDAARGRTIGSEIRMRGKVLGISLAVRETVTERVPPYRKAWETEPNPRLLVVGRYRMGFEIAAEGHRSRLTVFIAYALPPWPWRLLALIAHRLYARWCTQSMAADAEHHFSG